MDREIIYTSDFYLDKRETSLTVFWFDIYQEKIHGKYRFGVYMSKRKHGTDEILNFNNPAYLATYINREKVESIDFNQVCYHERAARAVIREKVSALKRKSAYFKKVIEREEFIEKLYKVTNFFQKYVEE